MSSKVEDTQLIYAVIISIPKELTAQEVMEKFEEKPSMNYKYWKDRLMKLADKRFISRRLGKSSSGRLANLFYITPENLSKIWEKFIVEKYKNLQPKTLFLLPLKKIENSASVLKESFVFDLITKVNETVPHSKVPKNFDIMMLYYSLAYIFCIPQFLIYGKKFPKDVVEIPLDLIKKLQKERSEEYKQYYEALKKTKIQNFLPIL